MGIIYIFLGFCKRSFPLYWLTVTILKSFELVRRNCSHQRRILYRYTISINPFIAGTLVRCNRKEIEANFSWNISNHFREACEILIKVDINFFLKCSTFLWKPLLWRSAETRFSPQIVDGLCPGISLLSSPLLSFCSELVQINFRLIILICVSFVQCCSQPWILLTFIEKNSVNFWSTWNPTILGSCNQNFREKEFYTIVYVNVHIDILFQVRMCACNIRRFAHLGNVWARKHILSLIVVVRPLQSLSTLRNAFVSAISFNVEITFVAECSMRINDPLNKK